MARSMNPQDIRDFVRAHLDVDEDELPTNLLDRFMYDGGHVCEQFGRYTFREVQYTLATTINLPAYDLDSEAGLITPAPLARIQDVRGPNRQLRPLNHRATRDRYRASTIVSSEPKGWSLWGRSLYLWPPPSAVEDLTITGYRQQADWLESNNEPDFPAEFHELIAWWALARGYVHQDDLETAEHFRAEFATHLKNRAKPYLEGNSAQPFVVNGGELSGGTAVTQGGFSYPFEW